MRLTEEEAKTTQCHQFPAAIIPLVETGHVMSKPSHQMQYGWGNCVGSKCAAWRWMREVKVGAGGIITQPVIAEGTESPVGYCGYAGRPD